MQNNQNDAIRFGSRFLPIICLTFLMNACSLLATKPAEYASVRVSVENQDRIRFSGKGAGAGMMMSASMGAMGIAIGVAIDEGIAKDIHESFSASGNNFTDIVKTETETWLSKLCVGNKFNHERLCNANTAFAVRIYRYGFVTTSGEGDPVKPELDIGFVLGDQKELRLNLKDSDDLVPVTALDNVKTDGTESFKLLKSGYQILLEKYQKQAVFADQ